MKMKLRFSPARSNFATFDPRQRIYKKGEVADRAYVLVSGEFA